MAKIQFIAMHQFMANMIEPIAIEMRKRGHTIYENYKGSAFEGNQHPKFKENQDATVVSYHHFLNDKYRIRKHKPVFFMEHCVSVVKSAYGTPLVSNGRTLVDARTDYVFIQGPMFMEWFKLNCPTHKGALPTGWPRIEALINTLDTKEKIIKKHKLERNKPIILYVPTWASEKKVSPISGTMEKGWPVLVELNIPNLLCTAHPSDYYSRYVYNDDPRVVLDANTYEYIKAADLIIGDVSSILLESTVLDKPIIQLNQYDNLKNFQLFPAWTNKSKACPIAKLLGIYQLGDIVHINKRQIKHAIEDALNDPDKYKAHRKFWRDKAFYNLGNATKACADAMEDILGKA